MVNSYRMELELKNIVIKANNPSTELYFQIKVQNPTKIILQQIQLSDFILQDTLGFLTYEHTLS